MLKSMKWCGKAWQELVFSTPNEDQNQGNQNPENQKPNEDEE